MNDDREIVQTRLLEAPREIVWAAWTDPVKLAKWWGPDGFHNEIHELDLRPGGLFRLTMVGPDGTRYPNEIRYRVVEAPLRLVYAHSTGIVDDPLAFETEVRFDAVGARTRVTMTARFQDPAVLRWVVEHRGAVEGGRQTLAHLARMVEEEDALVVSRVLRASPARVWEAWTQQLGLWWGPRGMEVRVLALDLRPGGIFHYTMTPPGADAPWYGRMVFHEITPIERLAWINSFSDPAGGLGRAPFAPTFPAEIFNILTLEPVEGGTRITVRGQPIRADEAEKALFRSMREDMGRGFGGSFDQLEALLAERP